MSWFRAKLLGLDSETREALKDYVKNNCNVYLYNDKGIWFQHPGIQMLPVLEQDIREYVGDVDIGLSFCVGSSVNINYSKLQGSASQEI